jgi:serine/threonine protein phosphatase PrpC
VLKIRLAALSEAGAREHNEDDMRFGSNGSTAYAVLSDGAGGHKDGALAADIVVRCIAMRLQAARELAPQQLHEAVHEAHELLLQHQERVADRDRMHATAVALWVDAERELALWSHVGESRLYLLRGGHVHHVTRDDSVVTQMLEAGLITAEAAATHPLKHHLALAMGVAGGFDAHTLQKPFALDDGDVFLLCSDGWWDAIDNADLEQACASAAEPQAWLAAMAARIRAAARPRQDNFSAIALGISAR